MEFAIYSRKSKQTGKGASIQYQIDCCKEYIVNHFGEQNNIHIFVIAKSKTRKDGTYAAKNFYCRALWYKCI